MEQALSDVRVLDLSGLISGPTCAKLLADQGAQVLKVEPPEGDVARTKGPFYHDDPHPERSGLFLYCNTNKRGITLNLDTAAGRRILRRLVQRADMVIESFAPGVMDGWGLGFDALRERNPGLVQCSITGFGHTGPYRDWQASDIVIYGVGGPMRVNTADGQYPLKLPGFVTQFHAGYLAAVAALIALTGSRRHGIGQQVESSMMEGAAMSVDRRLTGLMTYQYHGWQEPEELPPGRGAGFPCGTFPCKDGYINIWGGLQYFRNSARMMGLPELMDDPKWAPRDQQMNTERREEFDLIFLPWIIDKTKLEFLELARTNAILSGALFTIEDVANDPHYQARGFFPEISHPETGPVKYPGPLFKLIGTDMAGGMPAPLLGQHNREVYRGELGYSKGELVQLREAGVI